MKPSAHNRWLERSFNKEDEPFDLGGSFSCDTVQPVTSFASCQQDQRLGGGPNLSSKACCPFLDICCALYLTGLPPALGLGEQLSISRSCDLSYQPADSSLPCVWSSQGIFGNFPHTGRLGLPCTPHGFLFLARGTTPHSAHCCASYSD